MLRARVLAIVTIAAAISAAPAHAATLKVTTTVDETNAGDSACSLREAISAVDSPGSANGDCAPAAFGANTIVLGASTYTLGNSFPGQHDELLLGATANVTIAGAGEGKTVLDATGLGNRVFEIASGATVTISDLTINGGRAPDGAAGTAGTGTSGGVGQPGANGGAILNSGTLNLGDAAVTNSRAGNGGTGGTSAAGPAAQGGAGGAGGSGGAIFSTGTLRLTGVTIANNQSGGGGAGGNGTQDSASNPGGAGGNGGAAGAGGGVANDGGSLTIAATTVRGNTAGNGGAGGTGGSSPAGGGAPGGVGGTGGAGGSGAGISTANAPLSVTNSTVASNTTGNGASGGSGGIGVGASSTGGSGGAGGSGGSGGGIAVNNAVSSTVLNATVVGNKVGQGGSGGAGGTGTTAGGPGAAGAAGAGGGVTGLGSSSVGVQNSLLALNSAGNCGAASVSDGGNNLSFGGTGCPASFAAGDPNLGALQDNGGPTQTISIGPGSAAIDKIPATGAGCPATDQRGVRRPAGTSCDIGAYEVAGPAASTAVPTNLGRTTATLNGSVTPNAGTATVEFDYGTTTKYGSKVIRTIGGVIATPVSAKVSRLKAKTRYHFRIVVTTTDGTVTRPDRAFSTSPPPVLGRLKITPSAFRASGRGVTISYTDSLAAKATFVVLGRAPRSRRFVRVGSFTHKDKIGPNSVRFNGRLRSRKLPRGSYRLELTARANGRTSRKLVTTFRITG